MARQTLIDWNPSKPLYYPLAINLDRCVISCKTTDDWYDQLCVTNKTKQKKVKIFDMIKRKNKSKSLVKHVLCYCRCRLDGEGCNSKQK